MKSIIPYFILLLLGMQVFAQTAKLRVKVTGYEELVGNLSIGLFSDPEGFPKKSANSVGVDIEILDTVVTYTFNELKDGVYALAIFHDENGNGELDQNFLGMPTEDYVFSNYATGTFGPPSFEDAKFSLKDSLSVVLLLNK
ncbi:MAG: DUF2141 domain-containing protein [Melioribacteraceae bacterium]|nr:DUF2141 domain-containing protein [Melioribacteraceae bacterium]